MRKQSEELMRAFFTAMLYGDLRKYDGTWGIHYDAPNRKKITDAREVAYGDKRTWTEYEEFQQALDAYETAPLLKALSY